MRDPGRRGGWLRAPALAGAAFALAFFAAEGVLRAVTPAHFGQSPFPGRHHWMAEDPILGFANRPGFVHRRFEINDQGFRGPPLRAPGEAASRVVCLGDSGTFGIWLDEGVETDDPQRIRYDNYPELLGRALARRGIDAEVINGGVVGYTAAHGLRLLASRVVELRPDVVTVRFGLNDHKITPENSGRLVVEPESEWLRRALYEYDDWRLLRLFLAAWRKADWARPGSERMVRMLPPKRFEATLRRFAALSRQHGFALLFVDYPLRPIAWGEHPHYAKVYLRAGEPTLASFHERHRIYQRIVERVARREGVPLLETDDRLTDRTDPGFALLDFVHPDARGAEKLAEAIAETAIERGWARPEGP